MMMLLDKNKIGACVFDAYGTLFNVSAAAAEKKNELGENWEALSTIWRTKQLEYTWLRSLMGAHADFWQVTGDALDYAMDTLSLEDSGLREDLMQLYLKLEAYPEVKDVLSRLQQSGIRAAILSNGSPKMLASAVKSAQLGDFLEAVLSAEEAGIFKTHPSVYQLAVDKLALEAGKILFFSSNAWDVAGASNFGLKVVWVNRFGQKRERLPHKVDVEITTLEEVPALFGL